MGESKHLKSQRPVLLVANRLGEGWKRMIFGWNGVDFLSTRFCTHGMRRSDEIHTLVAVGGSRKWNCALSCRILWRSSALRKVVPGQEGGR